MERGGECRNGRKVERDEAGGGWVRAVRERRGLGRGESRVERRRKGRGKMGRTGIRKRMEQRGGI